MVEALPDNRPTIHLGIPASPPLYYFPDRGGLFVVRAGQDGEKTLGGFPDGLVPLLSPEHPSNPYLFPDPTSQESFVLGSGDSLIELPPLRNLLAEAYKDDKKRKAICRQVEAAMACSSASCEFDEYGVFKLTAGDVRLVPNLNPYDLTFSLPVKRHPTPEDPTPLRPDPLRDTSLLIAYWRTPGPEHLVASLMQGAKSLALAVRN